MNLRLAAPITTWDEALPLGNGLKGALLWGEGGTLRISLDRGDLWDERPAPGNPLAGFTYARMARLVAARDNASIVAVADGSNAHDTPTKIPAGRIEIDLAPGQELTEFTLDLPTATAHLALGGNGAVQGFFCATEPVALLVITGAEPQGLRLLAPESVKKLGYAAPEPGHEGRTTWFVQPAVEGARYCVLAGTKRVGEETLVAATVTFSSADGDDVVGVARQRVNAALAAGYAELHAAHAAWWREFWAQSSVEVPDEQVMLHYQLVQYFYGAASRRGAPPIPLQGVWTADAGELPPWKGDYHHDLNTQMTYMAYQASGRFDAGLSFLEFMHGLLPAFRKYAREFLETPGAAVPAVMSLAGQQLGGWAQYSLSPVHGAWVGHLYYLHWRHTRDETFLRDMAYPWCREIGEALRALLKPNADGALVMPVSASPEAWNRDMRSWVKPNSNYDIMCLRMFFLGNAEMAAQLGEEIAAKEWAQLAEGLGPYHVNAQRMLKISADEDLTFSHRHFATIMGIYPFNLLHVEGSATDREIITASVHDLDRLGVLEWVGFSYTWMAALRARINEPESALWYLKAYLRACILRNGFHVNGDQTKTGFTSLEYRPFTMEGNFLAGAAVHEMLLQSWATQPGSGEWGPIRVFPAMPWAWHDASFTDLVAEGGHKVSARRENNATTWLRITAGATGELRIRDNFDGRPPQWNRADGKKEGDDFIFVVAAGDVIEAVLPKPATWPPSPPAPPAPADHWDGDVPLAPKDPGVRMSNDRG
ncbi:MAG: glycoside hydrolase N-terminal domain-containing protein [Cephaloticoccus sp.]|nr:glycoside hydrolase N-terminal domain-containing protein [Cephaloticoccus sp.]MCF7762009.1 glycoside hydrolase N-terminal domain-containing protein [Cephaloticoccus sp.]